MKCKTCKGSGFIEKEFKKGPNKKPQKIKEICETCDGEGKIQKRKRGNKNKGFDWSLD